MQTELILSNHCVSVKAILEIYHEFKKTHFDSAINNTVLFLREKEIGCTFDLNLDYNNQLWSEAEIDALIIIISRLIRLSRANHNNIVKKNLNMISQTIRAVSNYKVA